MTISQWQLTQLSTFSKQNVSTKRVVSESKVDDLFKNREMSKTADISVLTVF